MMCTHPAPHSNNSIGITAVALVSDIEREIGRKQFICRWHVQVLSDQSGQLYTALQRKPHS